MSYCTLTDITKAISEEVVKQLTDDDNLGVINEDNVNAAIVAADATIDAYCQQADPFSPVPAKVIELAVDIAVYNLYSRSDLALPEIRKDRYSAALRFLEKVAEGKISQLGTTTPAPATAEGAEVSNSNARIFTRTTLDGF
jgi:phage gp36-like protein